MVTEGDHFSLTSDFLLKFLTDFKNFSCFEIFVHSFSNSTIFDFRKSQNYQSLFCFPYLSANRNLENKIGNVIQHIKKPISVKKFRRIKQEGKNGHSQ